MPIYEYIDDESGEIHEVVQGMNDKHEFYIEGRKLRRLFSSPNASIDSNIDPSSINQFMEKTSKMRGTIGEMQDYSRELSERRGGESDPVRQKHYSDYSKKRNGKEHPDVVAKKKKERLKNLESKIGVKISE
jgi:hypothetical protein